MTEKAFRDGLRALDKHDEASRQHAGQAFARYTPDEWVEALLVLWPGQFLREFWFGAGCLLFLAIAHGVAAWWDPAALVRALLPSMLVGSGLLWRVVTSAIPPSLVSLLARLDDIRLVPLWLENLPRHSARRHAFLERLIRHLPNWHTIGQPLPEKARAALLREVRWLLVREPADETSSAFLTAALVSLDNDVQRGIPADTPTVRTLSDARLEGDPHVRAAAADAVQRLGRPGV